MSLKQTKRVVEDSGSHEEPISSSEESEILVGVDYNSNESINNDTFTFKFKKYKIIITKTNIIITVENKELFTICNFDGYWSHKNSVLIKLNDHKYQYIGNCIYTFETSDIIKFYICEYEPYPIACGENNIYFIDDKEFIDIDKFELELGGSITYYDDLYECFYDYENKNDIKNMDKIEILHK